MIQYLIEQAHSRHTYQLLLGIQKSLFHDIVGLEDQLVAVMMRQLFGTDETALFTHWLRISAQFVTMGLSSFVGLRAIIEKLSLRLEDVAGDQVAVGRNFLMWSIYQFIAVLPAQKTTEFLGIRSVFYLFGG